MDIRPPERAATEPAGKRPRNGMLMRTCAWGVCAALAVATLLVAAQGPAASTRIERALSGSDETPPPPRPVVADATPEHAQSIAALQAKIDELTQDRDRLAGRIASLERNLEDMTGSIAKSDNSRSESVAKTAPLEAAAVAPAPMVVAAPTLLPKAPIVLDPLATPPAGVASVLPDAPPQLAAREPEAKPPEQVAALTPPAEPAKRAPPHARAEFGVELATAPNMDGLRQNWTSAKANFGPLLVGLNPVAVRDRHPGSKAVRLVAGPLPSITAARKLCAQFASLNGNCWPARIDPADVVR